MKEKACVLHKRSGFALILLLIILVCCHVGTARADINGTISSGDNFPGSGLYMDIHELEEYRAEKGLRNLEPHAIYLSGLGLKAYNEERKKEATMFFEKASEISPDLPTPYIHLAKISFSLSPKGLYSALGYLLDAWRAFRNNFWWSFQAAGVLFMSLFFAFYASIFIFLVTLMYSKFQLYIHDVIEDKRRIFLLLPPVVLVFFGPIFGIIGLMLPFWIYMKKREQNVLYSVIAVSAVIILMFPLLSSFIDAFQNKTLRAVVEINEGKYTGAISEKVGGESGFESAFAYALDLKRKGHYNEAIRVYNELLKQRNDARIHNNLANCYIGLGKNDMAIKHYDTALKLKKMASSNYNLSQLNREIFKFPEAEQYYQKAININPRKVAIYNSVRGTSVNRFVMDEYLSNKELARLAFKRNAGYKSSVFLGRTFSFTNRVFSIFLLLLLAAAFYMSDRFISHAAYRCRRCGMIFCRKCEKRLSHEDVCIKCFRTLIKVSELSPRKRIERILEIQRYRDNRNHLLKLLTLIFPGSGHIYYGWSVHGALILLLFTFFAFSTLLWFYIPIPVSVNIFKWLSAAGLVLVYGSAAFSVFRRVPRKWL